MTNSTLEFMLELQLTESGITFEREYRFDQHRQWRFDFAMPEQMLAIECEGAVFANGRHTRGSGYIKDLEKYNEAVLQGWRVLRYWSEMIESGAALNQIEAALGIVREVDDGIPF
jgi:very-short-patch-repair endonuclease